MSDHRVRALVKRARSEGVGGISTRLVRRLYDRLDAAQLDFPLLVDDIADSTRLHLVEPSMRPNPGTSLTVGWISTPPGAGSGGHTTMFRMIQALEAAGHTCVLYLYDRHNGDLDSQAAVVRQHWPWIQAQVRSAHDLKAPLDACVATSWPSAHFLANRGNLQTRRLYFVQDYEPFFYGRGSQYTLAEDTYRFGFRLIALGHMVEACLRDEVGADSAVVPFGCDTDTYRLTNLGPRSGVVLYAKPGVERRGFRLAQLALQEFHRRHPTQEIHVYGHQVERLGFPATHHSRLAPDQLNSLYNSVIAGIAMSFTNISLVAEELLASGATPVINDSPYARADLPHLEARWAPATPGGLADVLSQVVEGPQPGVAEAAARSVRRDGWVQTGARVTQIIEDEVYGPHRGITSVSTAADARIKRRDE